MRDFSIRMGLFHQLLEMKHPNSRPSSTVESNSMASVNTADTKDTIASDESLKKTKETIQNSPSFTLSPPEDQQLNNHC